MRAPSSLTIPLVLLLAAAGCTRPAPRTPRPPDPALPDRIAVGSGSRILQVPLEEYVLGSVLAELTPVGESPAVADRLFEVQAILARTYAAGRLGRHRSQGFDLCDATHCQLYDPARITTSRFARQASEAVRRTAGFVLLHAARVAEAVYHADCGGVTASADRVWGGPPVPYLLARPDDVPAARHRQWEVTVSAGQLRRAVATDPRLDLGPPESIRVLDRDDSGRAARLEIRGATARILRGEDFRALLNRVLSPPGVQSTRFTLSASSTGGHRITGTGFGHGVGLCQAGAAARARRNETLDRILGAYYPGTRLTALAARGGSPPAFDGRCIPFGCVAPPSNTRSILGRRALPIGRIARLGAAADFHHGLLATRPRP